MLLASRPRSAGFQKKKSWLTKGLVLVRVLIKKTGGCCQLKFNKNMEKIIGRSPPPHPKTSGKKFRGVKNPKKK